MRGNLIWDMGAFANVGGGGKLGYQVDREGICAGTRGLWGAGRIRVSNASRQKKRKPLLPHLIKYSAFAPRQKAKQARQRHTVSFVGLLVLARRKEG